MSTLFDYTEAIEVLAPGEHPVDEAKLQTAREKAVARAMDAHSRHKPVVVVEDVDGDGGFDYALSGLASWEDNFSVIRQVEYPVDDDDETPGILEDNEWAIYEKPSGRVLRMVSSTPQTGESIRVTYTARHACTVSDCSVDAGDEEAVQSLAASFFCRILSAMHAQDQDSTIDADSVDHAGKRREYEALAKTYRGEYYNHMGIKEGRPKPASHTQDQDVDYPWGQDRLTHPRRRR